MGVRGLAMLAGLVLLAACQKPMQAPVTAGVCWRLAPAMNGTQDFRPFADGIENLENCAVRLEGLYLAHGQPMVGAFQGRMIYVTDQDITSAANDRAQRYRVFTPEQRAKIDAGFKTLRDREKAGS